MLSRDELVELYVNQRLTSRAIAKRTGVCKGTILKWLKSYDIERRPSGVNREGTRPTKDELAWYIHVLHLPYYEIAKIYGVDTSTVPFWLDKHNIERANRVTTIRKAPFPKPSREELSQAYWEEGLGLEELAKRYDVAQTTVGNWFNRLGIKRRDSGWRGEWPKCEDGHIVRSLYEMRVDNWLSSHNLEHQYEPQVPGKSTWHADFLVNGWYIEIWGVDQSHHPEYLARKRQKQAWYKAREIPLIEIPASAFGQRAKERWRRKLERHLLHIPKATAPSEQLRAVSD